MSHMERSSFPAGPTYLGNWPVDLGRLVLGQLFSLLPWRSDADVLDVGRMYVISLAYKQVKGRYRSDRSLHVSATRGDGR